MGAASGVRLSPTRSASLSLVSEPLLEETDESLLLLLLEDEEESESLSEPEAAAVVRARLRSSLAAFSFASAARLTRCIAT